MDQSERAARERTRSIPDGVYEAESYMDDDGVEIGKRIPIKVRVIKSGEDMTIDLSGCSPERKAAIVATAKPTSPGCIASPNWSMRG